MATKEAFQRLQKEYRSLCKQPVSQIVARPNPNDILDFHYVLEGSEGTPFAGGYYYGRVKFPSEYPYKPPGITMTTPNGRFATQKNLCLSMSNFHPETWNPMWCVSSILTGLLSFMMDYKAEPTTGSVVSTDADKKRLAKSSLAYNCKISTFRKMFPEYVEKYEQMLSEQPACDPKESPVSSKLVERRKVPSSDGRRNATGEEMNMQEAPVDARNRRKSFPAWGLLLLISMFGAVMALPLLL